MSLSCARQLTLVGLFLGLVGVVILFYFGMPFHVPTHGFTALGTEAVNKADIALERRYTIYGYIGFACLVLGTCLQMLALLPSRTK